MTIKRIGPKKWRVQSKRTHRNMGTFRSKRAANRRIQEIEYFKKKKK